MKRQRNPRMRAPGFQALKGRQTKPASDALPGRVNFPQTVPGILALAPSPANLRGPFGTERQMQIGETRNFLFIKCLSRRYTRLA
jgi:hypothetical protein